MSAATSMSPLTPLAQSRKRIMAVTLSGRVDDAQPAMT